MGRLDKVVVHDIGGGSKVEIRLTRHKGGGYEFRPVYNQEPGSMSAIEMNVELRFQGGAWAPVPEHLHDEAHTAFEEGK